MSIKTVITFLKDSERTLPSLILVIVIISVFSVFALGAPSRFPAGELITVQNGDLLVTIAQKLEDQNVIQSSFWFEVLIRFAGVGESVKAGDYVFEKRLSAPRLARRLVRGIYGLDVVSVRLPEGATRLQMADILERSLERFDRNRFLEITEGKEGYLFPDTYIFLPTIIAERVATQLEETFLRRVKSIENILSESGRELVEVVTMASLIVKEVSDPVDQRLVSGVLWKRLELGMPLQVDAPFLFLIGKGSSELTSEDLDIDSPYNTYKYKGLPPGPIANPGLDAIMAALNPTESGYLFYLSDSEGVTHYAEDFEGHKRNKEMYLSP